jgi:hypothetical protein
MTLNTYDELDVRTLTTSTPSVTFSAIPQNYTDLVIVMSSANVGGAVEMRVGNGSVDTGSNYSRTFIYGDGITAASGRGANLNLWYLPAATNSTTVFGTAICSLSNYSNTTNNKVLIYKGGDAPTSATAGVLLWRSTAAINIITLTGYLGDFAAGSTFSLYGIRAWAAETTPKATGGYVSQDSTYWYHAFPFSSTFTPNQSLTADVLVVAGGGGGGTSSGNDVSGGGGAGGLLAHTSQSLTATNYAITVGAGGAGAATAATNGSSGNNSQFASLTASVGGGYGAGESGSRNGGSGGSGGGGGGYTGTAGTGTAGQGNNGAAANVGGTGNGGGGGGAGGAASERTGGIGTSSYSSWGIATQTGHAVNGIAYYAGGGGGGGDARFASAISGLGGWGGGGDAQNDISGAAKARSGIVSTGGGGGGSASSRTGSSPAWIPAGSGGSGLVIIRYAK